MKEIHQIVKRCPLCGNRDCASYHEDVHRRYIRCRGCELIFVPSGYWLSTGDERAEYDLHENNVDDPGYRRFLSRLVVPLLGKLAPNQCGMDFGCGMAPALAAMMEEGGHRMALFDPFYANNPGVLDKTYDFICTTEVVEHLRDPLKEFSTLFSCLKPGGWLGIMTKMTRNDREAFSKWHYIRDLTHICFYHQKTFEHIAHTFSAEAHFLGQDVILFQKRT